jgi:hypothetical protein
MRTQLIRLYINGIVTGVCIEYYVRVKAVVWPLFVAILLFIIMVIDVVFLLPYNKSKEL